MAAQLKWTTEQRKINDLIPYEHNPRQMTEKQIKDLTASLKKFDLVEIPAVNTDGIILAGHQRLRIMQSLGRGDELIDVRVPSRLLTDKEVQEYNIRSNKNTGEWDFDILANAFDSSDLVDWGFDAGDLNIDAYQPDKDKAGNLIEKFLVPPFSVLDARQGYWSERKQEWLALGIESGIGREDKLLSKGESLLTTINNGTSIFDPVLCEVIYSWFCPAGGAILDPFAGGSVRGIVAAKTGHNYLGVDLRSEQVGANIKQAQEICQDNMPKWLTGDSLNIADLAQGYKPDLIFSCPPYADLEVYSDDQRDLSTMPYQEFKKVYTDIIANSCQMLKDNSFACFVVGEVRDKKGNYYNFVGDTIQAFIDAGLSYYNEIVLVTPVGTLPIRTSRLFPISRKIGKTHQNVLVFLKGDSKKANERCGLIEIADINALDQQM